MSQAYNDALKEQLRKNVADSVKVEARGLDALEQATLAADVLGFLDPTPTCDLIGMSLSLLKGDLWGAGASALGAAVPYLGDMAKIGKVAKVAPKTAEAMGKIANVSVSSILPTCVS
jgi:hypothetical protein